MDLKITDWCDAGCPHCHENSTVRGKHANVDFIINVLVRDQMTGAEWAIGGGDPLSHPQLEDILNAMHAKRQIANLTVNGAHIRYHADVINRLRFWGLIHGLGVSYTKDLTQDCFNIVYDENTVLHVIAGIDDVKSVLDFLIKFSDKINVLVLGAKTHGRGNGASENELRRWSVRLPALAKFAKSLSFDNLAIDQLEIKSKVSAKLWDERYMGTDGTTSIYIDAVEQEFAVSSTSTVRHPLKKWSDIFILKSL